MSLINALMKMAGIKCPRCAYPLSLKELKAAQSTGQLICPQCQHVFQRGSSLDDRATIEIDKSNYRPSTRLKISHHGPEFLLQSRWFSPASWPILIFTLLWNGFIAFIIGMIFFVDQRALPDIVPAIIIGLFALIGMGMIVFSLRELINSSYFSLRLGEIKFWTSPLSFQNKKTLNMSEVKDITIRRADGGRVNNKKLYNHYVCAHLKNGEVLQMIRVRDMNEAIYVEKLLEEKLSLKDDPSLDRIEG